LAKAKRETAAIRIDKVRSVLYIQNGRGFRAQTKDQPVFTRRIVPPIAISGAQGVRQVVIIVEEPRTPG
jgi:hypothetical protein